MAFLSNLSDKTRVFFFPSDEELRIRTFAQKNNSYIQSCEKTLQHSLSSASVCSLLAATSPLPMFHRLRAVRITGTAIFGFSMALAALSIDEALTTNREIQKEANLWYYRQM
jgi:hypothetical protein